MSSINLYDLYKRKTRKYGVNYSQETFKETFVDAVNLVYSEMNEKVFQAHRLEMIGSFDDVIDERLASFDTITHVDSNVAVGEREYWSAEYEFERTSGTNSFVDTFVDNTPRTVILGITDGVFSISGNGVDVKGTADISTYDVFKLKFSSDSEGNHLTVNDEAVGITYTDGDAETSQEIGTVVSHISSATNGLELTRMRFLSLGTVIYDFLINEGTGDTLTDIISDYTATIASQVWEDRYIEPTTGLDERFRSALEYGLDWHLQDGGVWGLEDDGDREQKWYTRGIRSARNTNQQLTTYKSPLNPRGL